MRRSHCACVLIAALTTGPAFAQYGRSISDYHLRTAQPSPAPTINQAAGRATDAGPPSTVPAFLPPPPGESVSTSRPPDRLPAPPVGPGVSAVPPARLREAAIQPAVPPTRPAPPPTATMPPALPTSPGVVLQQAPRVPGPVFLATPPPPALPSVGGPLYEPQAVTVTGWMRAEALLWWVHGKSLPPVFSRSPGGTPLDQAGILGTPGAETVFGGDDPVGNPRWGGRLTGGLWFEHSGQVLGLEASYFRLSGGSGGATVGGPGGGNVSRPFVHADGGNGAQLVTYPGGVTGSASASLDATSLAGADLQVRYPIPLDPCNPRPRLDLLVGYRWLGYGEDFGVRAEQSPTGAAFVPGTGIVVADQFRVRNDFHGGTFGLAYGGQAGRFTYDLTGKASLGHVSRRVTIDGSTTVTVPGDAPVVSAGGLLAQRSNIGEYSDGKWTVIPEVEFRLGYAVTSSLRLTAGYSLLVLSDFDRAGNVIDATVNANLIPPNVTGVGPQRPAYHPGSGSIWVHGLSLGAELRF